MSTEPPVAPEQQQPPVQQGPQVPPPVPPTPPVSPPPPKRRRLKGWHWALIAVGGLLLIGVIANLGRSPSQSPSAQTTTPPATATTPPQPSPTSPPPATATPAPQLTPEQQLQQLAQKAVPGSKKVEVFWDSTVGLVEVHDELGMQWSEGSARAAVRSDVFDIQKAIWSSHIVQPKSVVVFVNGPAKDKYGNDTTAQYGSASLKAETAAKFNWSGLTPSTAWDAYDSSGYSLIIQG